MSFQESSDTLQSRLHLGELKPRQLIGLLFLVALLVAIGANSIVSLVAEHGFSVRKDGLSVDEGSGNSPLQAGDEETSAQSFEVISEPTYIFVHVSGCVGSPGVYALAEGSRVCDAIEAAGGFTQDAVQGYLNEARLLTDGEQLAVPSADDLAQDGAEGRAVWMGESAAGVAASGESVRVNINTASVEELATLDGIGEVTARKIVADREKNGAFATIEDIKRVSGIGDKKFDAIADDICV